MVAKNSKMSPESTAKARASRLTNAGKSLDNIERFWSYVNVGDLLDCWEWKLSTDQKGYGLYRFNGKQIRCHRISYMLYHGQIENGNLILHKCNNPLCVNPFHLYQGTNQDNMNDKVRSNRQAKGITNGKSKLTKEQVLEIRKNVNHYSARELGRIYGVFHSTIRRVQKSISYKDVKMEGDYNGEVL